MNGVKLEAKDLRIYNYEKVVGTLETVFPTKFCLSQRVTVKNQGDIGACLACVLASVAEYVFDKEMSEGFNYGMFREDRDKSPGLYLSKALNFATKLGFVPFGDFGVLQEVPEMRELAKKLPELLEIGQKYKISGYAEITSNKTKRDNEIKDALIRGNIGLVAVADKFFGECHAIMLIGWDDERDAYIFQNSWGKGFGVDGIAYIPKDEIDDVAAIITEPVKLPFEDVPEDAWYHKHVKNMYMSGLVNGTSETTFEPDRPITRAEICAILDRLCSAEEDNNARIFKVLNELIN